MLGEFEHFANISVSASVSECLVQPFQLTPHPLYKTNFYKIASYGVFIANYFGLISLIFGEFSLAKVEKSGSLSAHLSKYILLTFISKKRSN